MECAGKAFAGYLVPLPLFFFLGPFPFPFCHFPFTSSASLSTTRTVCGTGVAILLVSVLVRDFGLFLINVWSILYRYCLCMKATKLRLNSIQWHNIYSWTDWCWGVQDLEVYYLHLGKCVLRPRLVACKALFWYVHLSWCFGS